MAPTFTIITEWEEFLLPRSHWYQTSMPASHCSLVDTVAPSTATFHIHVSSSWFWVCVCPVNVWEGSGYRYTSDHMQIFLREFNFHPHLRIHTNGMCQIFRWWRSAPWRFPLLKYTNVIVICSVITSKAQTVLKSPRHSMMPDHYVTTELSLCTCNNKIWCGVQKCMWWFSFLWLVCAPVYDSYSTGCMSTLSR